MVDELGPFEKILKYIQEQKKMPHVATNIALKELTWPPENKAAANPPIDVSNTFPVTGDADDIDDDAVAGASEDDSAKQDETSSDSSAPADNNSDKEES